MQNAESFNSLEALMDASPRFRENFDANATHNISSVLDCDERDLGSFSVIADGLTNLSIRFELDGKPYVYRCAGPGTDAIISRESETFSQGVAKDLGIDRTFIFEDAKAGWKLSHFIEGCVPFDYHDETHVARAMEVARKLHGSGATSPWSFNVCEKAFEIADLLADPAFQSVDECLGPDDFPDYDSLRSLAALLDASVRSDGIPAVLCHNDFYEPNFLVHGDEIDLIDWEYSAMSDYASDLGTFVCCSDYGIDKATRVFAEYFQRDPTPEELRHCMAYVGLSAYYWFVWALFKDATGDPVGNWLTLWHDMAASFGQYARELYGNQPDNSL